MTTLHVELLAAQFCVVALHHLSQVLRESGVYNRLELAPSHGFTPLVGRDTELHLLLECWERAREGLGQVVLLSARQALANRAWCRW